MNKKKLWRKIISGACVGVAFGVTLCITLYLFRPLLKSILPEKKETGIVLQVGDEEATSNSKLGKEEYVPDDESLQYALYNVGMQFNKSLVGINLASSDGFEGDDGKSKVGCGVVFMQKDNDAYILTTPDALEGRKQAQITFFGGHTVPAAMVGIDEETKIAVLSVPLRTLNSWTRNEISIANLGRSDILNRGQFAIAVGAPLGQLRSVVTGHFTSVSGEIGYTDIEYSELKTDIYSENSTNGFLINKKGGVVGIIMPRRDDEQTVCAIGVSSITKIIEKLCNAEALPYLGVKIRTISNDAKLIYGISEGIFVQEVVPNSPAFVAGLHKGDIIVGIGKEDVMNGKQLGEMVLSEEPGNLIRITVLRATGGKYRSLKCDVTLGEREQR